MFERFTDRSRRVVVLAQEEARSLNHGYIGTEHLLLGLIDEADGVAAHALANVSMTHGVVQAQLGEAVDEQHQTVSGHIPFSQHARETLVLSVRKADEFEDSAVGTEHLLLSLMDIADGVAAQTLVTLGVDLDRLREEVLRLRSGRPDPE
jgi:ATP-dependent Clp protease ATP-binding subunit ClpC